MYCVELKSWNFTASHALFPNIVYSIATSDVGNAKLFVLPNGVFIFFISFVYCAILTSLYPINHPPPLSPSPLPSPLPSLSLQTCLQWYGVLRIKELHPQVRTVVDKERQRDIIRHWKILMIILFSFLKGFGVT